MLSDKIEICDLDYWIEGIFVILGKLSILENLLFLEEKCKNGILVIFVKKGILVIFVKNGILAILVKRGILVILDKNGIFVILHKKGYFGNFTLEGKIVILLYVTSLLFN